MALQFRQHLEDHAVGVELGEILRHLTLAESVIERVIDQLVSAGNDIIFTTSFGFMNPTVKVAARNPKVKFEHISGYTRADNLATANIRYYEGRYVAGVLAGKTTKSNTIGYIASFPIPEVIMGINSYYLTSDNSTMSYRTRIRTPSFAHLQQIPSVINGSMIPDLIAYLGSIDFVMADVDR